MIDNGANDTERHHYFI